ncbi:hypothetical protein P3S68_020173 [Capsicum galapagoense]
MPVCFGLKEFAIVMGLRCDRSEEPLIKEIPPQRVQQIQGKKDGLLGIVGRSSYKAEDLMADLEDKVISNHYRQKLCLVWFVHFVLLARDIMKVIEDDLLVLADDFDKFNDYPWGYDSYYLTFKYLLTKLSTRTITLYDFPWAFMLGWLAVAKGSRKIIKEQEANLFNPLDDVVFGLSHPSSPSYSHCKCKVCKDREDKLLEKLEPISETAEELKSTRGFIPSNKKIMNGKTKVQKEYTMHSFAAKDFMNTTNMSEWYKNNYVDEILCLMRGRQLAYPNAYDAADRIMDLNFYNNFNDRYDDFRKLAGSDGSRFDELVSTFQWDEDVIKYVRGKRPYLHDKSSTKVKRILAVMNVEVKHFFTVEIILYEGKIKVYDYNLLVFSEDMFLTHMQPLLKLLTQSKLMDHFLVEVLKKESWIFDGRNKNI